MKRTSFLRSAPSLFAAAALLAGTEARAQFGAHMTVTASAGTELKYRDIGGVQFPYYEVSVAWEGGCTSGDAPMYSVGVEGVFESGISEVAPGLTFKDSRTFAAHPGSVVDVGGVTNCGKSMAGSQTVRTDPIRLLITPGLTEPLIGDTVEHKWFDCFPVGRPVAVRPNVELTWAGDGEPGAADEVTVFFKGAGIDLEKSFRKGGDAAEFVTLLATSTGTVEHYAVRNGSLKSRVLQIKAEPGGCVADEEPAPSTDDPEFPDGSAGGFGQDEDPDSAACSTSAVASPQLIGLGLLGPLLAVWLARRRA